MRTVAGALGECVHVVGLLGFLRPAEAAGWRTVFLGPAVPVEEFLKTVRREGVELVGVSYLLPCPLRALLEADTHLDLLAGTVSANGYDPA
jgi:methanogenic corrinoid protein MtbC1